MGQAAVNAIRNIKIAEQLSKVDLNVIGNSIYKHSKNVFEEPVGNCVLYAEIGARVLRHLDVDADIVAGDALFCVNNEKYSAYISHDTQGRDAYTVSPNGGCFTGHCWIRVGNVYVDFSVTELEAKGKMLQGLDGHATPIEYDFGTCYKIAAKKVPKRSWLIAASNTKEALGQVYYNEQIITKRAAQHLIKNNLSGANDLISEVTNLVLKELLD